MVPSTPPRQLGQNPPAVSQFEYSGPAVLPNADVQIIRANHPARPLVIRLSDLLQGQNNPNSRSSEGDWINGDHLDWNHFIRALTGAGYFNEGETLWWNPLPLSTIDQSQLDVPSAGESLLSELNMVSVIERAIVSHYPHLRNPSPDPEGTGNRSPLLRPNFTMIVRSPGLDGKFLSLLIFSSLVPC